MLEENAFVDNEESDIVDNFVDEKDTEERTVIERNVICSVWLCFERF